MFDQLPVDLKREIIRYIPRNETAQLIHSAPKLALYYIPNFMFDPPHRSVWNDTRPSALGAMYYGNGAVIRENITKGERIRVKHGTMHHTLFSEIRH